MNTLQQLKDIGEKIRELREAAGFSQEAFAIQCGFSAHFYGCIERGEKNVSATTLMKIAKILDVHVGDLFPLIPYEETEQQTN